MTPRETIRLPALQRLAVGAIVRFFELTGRWRTPPDARGDFERMTFLDKAYWIYKTTAPVERARRGSGLEAHFARQRADGCTTPPGFSPRARLVVSSAGDLIFHPFLAGAQGTLYERVEALLFGADLRMANLECPIREGASRPFELSLGAPPLLAFDPASFAAVKGAGERRFDLLATACNHALDLGAEGLDATLEARAAAGVAAAGANRDEAWARRATLVRRNGFTIGVLAFTFGLNGVRPPPDRPHIVNRLLLNDGVAANDLGDLEAQLAHCREEGADFVITHLHWGFEHERYPRPEQVELAWHLAELGVDAIIGHHPHVLQPVEYRRTRRDPDRVVPIFYSLGNLVNGFSAPYLCRGGIARLELAKGTTRDGAERVYVERARMDEVVQRVDPASRRIWLEPAGDPVRSRRSRTRR